ncbi:MAG: MarR family transcriptional regulator [Pseudomonadota bacterium]
MAQFDLDGFLPYQLAVAARRVSEAFAARYRNEFGISIPEWRVVAHLSQERAVSVREIHRRVDMDKSKVSRAATRLEERGYVAKRTDPRDGRLVELTLTEKGREMMNVLAPIALAYQSEVLGRLGADATAFQGALETLLTENHTPHAEVGGGGRDD